jgi:hypothetical protein
MKTKEIFIGQFGEYPCSFFNAPMTREGWFDRRYTIGRLAAEWHDDQLRREKDAFIAGQQFQISDFDAWRAALGDRK